MQPFDDSLAVKVDRYIEDLFCPPDPVLQACLRDAHAAGLPAIQVSPVLGRTLSLVSKLVQPRRILEIGTLAGYSTICLSQGLTEAGTITTIEAVELHAEVARRNLARAGLLPGRCEVLLGNAADVIRSLAGRDPYDLIFIDADKVSYSTYLHLIEPLWRPGTVILADNVIRHGRVTNPQPPDPADAAVREFNQRLASHPALESVVLPTLREVLDGLSISRVRT